MDPRSKGRLWLIPFAVVLLSLSVMSGAFANGLPTPGQLLTDDDVFWAPYADVKQQVFATSDPEVFLFRYGILGGTRPTDAVFDTSWITSFSVPIGSGKALAGSGGVFGDNWTFNDGAGGELKWWTDDLADAANGHGAELQAWVWLPENLRSRPDRWVTGTIDYAQAGSNGTAPDAIARGLHSGILTGRTTAPGSNVPEPATLSLLALGSLLVPALRRRR